MTETFYDPNNGKSYSRQGYLGELFSKAWDQAEFGNMRKGIARLKGAREFENGLMELDTEFGETSPPRWRNPINEGVEKEGAA